MAQDNTPDDLTPKELKALQAIFSERTFTAAAKKAGVTRRTLYRFLERPAFRKAIREGVSRGLDELYAQLAQGKDDALVALAALITGKATGEAVRRLAASDWIAFFAKLGDRLELLEMSERIAGLEDAIKRGDE